MTSLADLATEIEEAGVVSSPERVVATLRDLGHAAAKDQDFDTTEGMLPMIGRAFPGWSIACNGVTGTADGHWVVLLRPTAGRDNAAFVGIGESRALPAAMLSAFLRALDLAR